MAEEVVEDESSSVVAAAGRAVVMLSLAFEEDDDDGGGLDRMFGRVVVVVFIEDNWEFLAGDIFSSLTPPETQFDADSLSRDSTVALDLSSFSAPDFSSTTPVSSVSAPEVEEVDPAITEISS